MKPYTHKAQYYETDRMGIIHHSNYIRWFEEARIDFLEQLGCPFEYLENELKLVSPVLEVTSQYRSMVRFGDSVDITVRMESFNGIKMKLSYEIHDCKTGELRTTGTSSHCFLNEQGRPISLKKEHPELFKTLSESI